MARVAAVSPALSAPEVRPPAALATITVVVGFAGLIASLVVLGVVAEGVRTQEVFALDTWATPFFHGVASPGLDAVMNTFTDIGTVPVIGPSSWWSLPGWPGNGATAPSSSSGSRAAAASFSRES
jgi:hypothetical protein